jgi:hypothetical protein
MKVASRAPARHPGLCYRLTGSDSLAVVGLLVGAVPRWEIRLVDAGHVTMHLRRPDAVRQAIRDLIGGPGR